MISDLAESGYFFQVGLWLGLVALIVVLILANRRAKLVSNSENDGGNLPRWNSYAVGAFALSFFWVVIPTILAIVAIVQISKTRQRGMGLAIAALAIQTMELLGLVAYIALHSMGPR